MIACLVRFLSLVALVGAGSPACAQTADLRGAWTWQSAGPSGMDRNTIVFQADGRFERVSLLANGTSLRYSGRYDAGPAGPMQIRLRTRTLAWLPRAICAQAPGFPVRCSPAPHPPEMAFVSTFTSPSTMQMAGVAFVRDDNPYLLQRQVPDRLVLAARAPVQPHIRQPVMPTLHPYQTPNGPGVGIAAANHAGAQNFINGYMRGCYKGTDGRLYGCEQ